jgi:hypothetical protein
MVLVILGICDDDEDITVDGCCSIVGFAVLRLLVL